MSLLSTQLMEAIYEELKANNVDDSELFCTRDFVDGLNRPMLQKAIEGALNNHSINFIENNKETVKVSLNKWNIIRYGLEVFGDKTKFRRWLCSITPASSPNMVIEEGWEFIHYELTCIEWGIYS